MSVEDLRAKIREIPDFPKPGILFYDITTLLKDPAAYREAIDLMLEPYKAAGIEIVVGMESRGFIFSAPMAYQLNAGLVPVRKLGKLPAETITVEYALEYGSNTLEIHRDAIQPGQKVLIVDDLLATGGTVKGTIELVERLKGEVVGLAFLVELESLKGRARLDGRRVTSVIQYGAAKRRETRSFERRRWTIRPPATPSRALRRRRRRRPPRLGRRPRQRVRRTSVGGGSSASSRVRSPRPPRRWSVPPRRSSARPRNWPARSSTRSDSRTSRRRPRHPAPSGRSRPTGPRSSGRRSASSGLRSCSSTSGSCRGPSPSTAPRRRRRSPGRSATGSSSVGRPRARRLPSGWR